MNNVCQYCLQDAEHDEELAEEIDRLGDYETLRR